VDAENPSATAVRNLMLIAHNWKHCIPHAARPVLEGASLHSITAGERAVLARLRTMTEAEFEALPYGSEGLWRKLMKSVRQQTTLEEILTATKSKRYTRTRLDRMVMCAFLGLTQQDLSSSAPYCRVLGFRDTGRALLHSQREDGFFVNIGTDTKHPYQLLERRSTALYGLFSETPEAPDAEAEYRVYYHRG
jgi:predicted nucleotidyltransferase